MKAFCEYNDYEIPREDFETSPEKTDNFIVIDEPPLENWGMGGIQK